MIFSEYYLEAFYVVIHMPNMNRIEESIIRNELVRDNFTWKQLVEIHNVSSDWVTLWLCLLKLSEEKLWKIDALGDYWDRQV